MAERILVVDDEEANRELLEAILCEDGYEVRLAADGPAALEAVAIAPPDLILLDLMMPGMNGLEVCRRVKSAPATGGVPVMVITAVGHAADKETLLASGADDYVRKPVDPTDLRGRVAALLRARRAHGELDRILAYIHELEADRLRQRHVQLAKTVGAPWPKLPVENRAIRVLLVSDDVLTQKLYANLLTERGFEVVVAPCGGQALTLARSQPVEVVILEVSTAEAPWMEMMERLRSQDPEMPVVILTEHATTDSALVALKAGATDCIVKGWDNNLTVLTLYQAVRHRRQLQSASEEIRHLHGRLQALMRELESLRKAGST